MARGVLERAGASIAGMFSGQGDGGPPPQAAMGAVFRMPSGPETEEHQRTRERAEEEHRQANPRSRPCVCGCMRWESGRGIDGSLQWLCATCKQRFQPRDPSQPIVRNGPPLPPPPAPFPSPAEARQALVAAVEAVGKAIAEHDSISKAAEAARSDVVRTEQAHEAAEQALTGARLQARDAAAVALQAGRAAPTLDLAKQRGEVTKTADAAQVARETRAELEAKQERARKALATAQARRDEAALTAIGVEIGPPEIARVRELVVALTTGLSRLGWLEKHSVLPWSPEVQALLALRGLAPRDWPQTNKLATETDAALHRALIALASNPATEIP
jgi:hypothetical protein